MILLIPSQHYVVWFAVYSVYSLLLDLPATLPKLYCCYICHRAINSFNLNKDSTKVQILTAFLFHSIHHVALRITLTSITCLPLQGLPTVNSVCPLGFNIGIPHPSQQYKSGWLPNSTPMELPNGLSPLSFQERVDL